MSEFFNYLNYLILNYYFFKNNLIEANSIKLQVDNSSNNNVLLLLLL